MPALNLTMLCLLTTTIAASPAATPSATSSSSAATTAIAIVVSYAVSAIVLTIVISCCVLKTGAGCNGFARLIIGVYYQGYRFWVFLSPFG